MNTPETRQWAEAQLGTSLLGKWRLERVLGVGGTSTVFAACHRNGARAAIKILRRELAEDSVVRARFLREAAIANRIRHPAVVHVLDDDDSGEQPFLVLELVEGRTLAELTELQTLDQQVLLDVAEQVLDALAVAHAAGVIHRDIKPQNLLCDRDGRLHVLDFGIARLLDDTLLTLLTSAHDLWGTLEYMAPEQLTGNEEISPRVDLYALGATLFRLASGHHVHEAVHPRERVLRTVSMPARSLAEVTDRLDPAIVRLVDRATRRSASERWSSAVEMRDAVRGILGRGVTPPPSSYVTEPPTRRERPSRIDERSPRDSDTGCTTRSGEWPVSLVAEPPPAVENPSCTEHDSEPVGAVSQWIATKYDAIASTLRLR